jgi:phytoene dehydrogenase-like protein
MTDTTPRPDVVIVGAGLAGLSAAVHLHRAGRTVQVLEASDGVGGRVRTDLVDGFRLDRGFQVLLTAYPEVRRQLDVDALDLCRFEPGAMVWLGSRGHVVADPLRRPTQAWATMRAPVGTLADKARLLGLRRHVRAGDGATLLRGEDISTLDALRRRGFTDRAIERLLRPLFAGIQLDPTLTTSNRMFEVIYRSLASGDSTVPANGMQAIPDQLAALLPPGTIRLDCTVGEIATGRVTLTTGERVEADTVIVAADGPAAHRLVGTRAVASRSVGCVYFAADRPPPGGRYVILDGTSAGPALNVAVLSNVAPSYAPPGHHLVACATPAETGNHLETDVRAQLRGWWGSQVDRWRHLRTYRIAHGQPDQQPPFSPKRTVTLGEQLFVCGDHRDTASIQGALYSGRRCAEAVLTGTVTRRP